MPWVFVALLGWPLAAALVAPAPVLWVPPLTVAALMAGTGRRQARRT